MRPFISSVLLAPALTPHLCCVRSVTTFGFTYGKLKGAEQSSYMLLLERCDCDLGSLIYPKAGSEEEALRIAAGIPSARNGSIELRPILSFGPGPEGPR